MRTIARARRIGRRHHVHEMTVGFNTRGRRRDPLVGRHLKIADVIDVSVSGAQLLAPTDPDVVVGMLITICAEDSVGTVRVARIAPVSQKKLCIVGVTFVHLDDGLQDYLLADLQDSPSTPLEVVWSR